MLDWIYAMVDLLWILFFLLNLACWLCYIRFSICWLAIAVDKEPYFVYSKYEYIIEFPKSIYQKVWDIINLLNYFHKTILLAIITIYSPNATPHTFLYFIIQSLFSPHQRFRRLRFYLSHKQFLSLSLTFSF